jgi:hypothetical protein
MNTFTVIYYNGDEIVSKVIEVDKDITEIENSDVVAKGQDCIINAIIEGSPKVYIPY